MQEPVLADADQLRQVIWNLLLNAAQSMPNGGVVDIEVATEEAHVIVRVRDQGVGIPEAELSQIFDPFFSSRSGGTGLGLATVERVVRDHGGTVRVESSPGKGSQFVIALPRGVERTPAPMTGERRT